MQRASRRRYFSHPCFLFSRSSSTGSALLSFTRWRDHVSSDCSSSFHVTVVEKKAYSQWLNKSPETTQAWAKINGFGKFKDGGLLMLGLGSGDHSAAFFTQDASDLYAFSSLPAQLAHDTPPVRLEMSCGGPLPKQTLLSWGLGCYRFDKYKSHGAKTLKASLYWPGGVCTDAAALDATFLVRDLINTPTEDLGPAALELATKELAFNHGATFESIVGNSLLTQNYPQVHAVGRGAAVGREPRILDMRWGDVAHPKVTLVGKGVCYDTGGLSIKPTGAMANMKKDMGGAAQVLGLAHMIMATGLPICLRVLIPAVENDISGGCMRNGDVLTARNGYTTEIMNTDAEGRLILADALVEACSECPALIVDCATLTGARTVALGLEVPAFFCNGAAANLAAKLQALSAQEQDQVWQLPLWTAYRSKLDSPIADIRNVGSSSSGAGAIHAALYLHEFVRARPAASDDASGDSVKCPPWLHFDLSAWHEDARPGRPKGGDAMGMRALYRLIELQFANPASNEQASS